MANQDGAADRFDQGAREAMANAFMGTSSVEMLRNATKGQEDIPRKIKLAIKRQYFTYSQVSHIAVFSVFFGMGLACMILVFSFGATNYTEGGAGIAKWAYIMGGAWVTSWFLNYETRGGFRCDPDKEGVDNDKRNAPCLDSFDCTIRERVPPGLCTHKAKAGWIMFLRNILFWGAPIAVAILGIAAVTSSERAATAEEAFISISFGLMIGGVWMFTWA